MHKAKIIIDGKTADTYKKLLTHKPKDESECFGENETIVNTATFDDGCEMDIKICGVQFETPESSLPYAEAVLFKNGSEIACTDTAEEYEGEWIIETADDTYVVNVVREDDISISWDFSQEDLDRINKTMGIEDDIYGFASIVTAKEDYILDVHYSYYSKRERYFCPELYYEAKDGGHGVWIGTLPCSIKSETRIKRFKARAEKLIREYIAKEEADVIA